MRHQMVHSARDRARRPRASRRVTPAALLALALGRALLGGSALAQDTTGRQGVRIGLTYQTGTRPGVLVLPIAGAWGDSIRAVVQRDLDYGDRVAIIGGEAAAALARAAPGSGGFNYPLYAQLGAAALVQIAAAPGGLHVELHDVGAKQVTHTRDFRISAPAPSREWRLALHGVSDEVEYWITGVRGVAQTRVAYVRQGKVYVVDSDGFDERPLSAYGTAFSPAWHPAGRYLAYSAIGERGSQIVVQDLTTGRARPLPQTAGGLNTTPTFSPDGFTLVYAHGEDEGTDLFAVSPYDNTPARRVTVGRGSDNVSPSFSPDGRRIAFTSGRSGHPEVYIMDADGTNVEQLTPFAIGDQYYRSSPDWSPDGRAVAFQSLIDDRFQLMTIGLRDRSVRQLTSEGANEDPSWAADGRHLVFTSNRSGSRELWVLDAESGRARQLTHGGGRLAAWSARLDRTP